MTSVLNEVKFKGNSFVRNIPTLMYVFLVMILACLLIQEADFYLIALIISISTTVLILFLLRKEIVVREDTIQIKYAFSSKEVDISEILKVEWVGPYGHAKPTAITKNGESISLEPAFYGDSIFKKNPALGLLSPLAMQIDPMDRRNINVMTGLQKYLKLNVDKMASPQSIASTYLGTSLNTEEKAVKSSKLIHFGIVFLILFWSIILLVKLLG